MVLGTQEATPLQFWFSVRPGSSVQLDDLVVLKTAKPGGESVTFYGVVDQVRKIHEGVSFESDVEDVVAGVLPASVSYSAHVLVTRVDPEEFVPPAPGDPVWLAEGEDLQRALYQDSMAQQLPAGVLRNGQPVALNFDFLSGASGAHVNISGVSGVATKTSYALFLLYSIFNSPALGAERANTKAVIFNVKGEDLLFLDQHNMRLEEKEARTSRARGLSGDRYAACGLPRGPFQDVQFMAPPRAGDGEAILPDVEQRKGGVTPYLWTIRDFCLGRLLPYCFADRDASLNLGFLISQVEERLYRLAQGSPDAPFLAVDDWKDEDPQGSLELGVRFDTLGRTRIETFPQLVAYIEFKLLEQHDGSGDPKWVGKQQMGTLQALVRRLKGVSKHLTPLVRGDLTAQQAARYRPDVLKQGVQLSVVDIHNLNAHAQMFVVGVILKELFDKKEKQGRKPYVFVVLDELNKYAPREGESPIKDVLLDIAERGRSLGIILIGAQQTASEVERRVTSNAAVKVVGRLDPAEAERPEYRFLPGAYRLRASILQPGTMILQQPEVPTPVMVTFPFPAWATRRDEVKGTAEEDLPQAAADWLA
ncbi:ATP-binding protein [Deinobacterium chartae]|nr:ATP-binding protein [Deinobacterium chartae]